jgi:hypothetical protein
MMVAPLIGNLFEKFLLILNYFIEQINNNKNTLNNEKVNGEGG